MSLKINSLENLPSEKTLLIHYTINCSGEWDLLQLASAYRNVCDDSWTVMFPNDQHPRHTDFTISVPMSGSVAATFAWNYGGIVGIDAEDFDENHSYLVQLACFNAACSGFSGSGSGQTSGDGNSGSSPSGINPPSGSRRPPEDTPDIPGNPGDSPDPEPNIDLPGGPGGPGDPNGSISTPINTLRPGGPGGPDTEPDGRIDDWDLYYYNRDSYVEYPSFDTPSTPVISSRRSPSFNIPLNTDPPSSIYTDFQGLDDGDGLGNQFNSQFNSNNKNKTSIKNVASIVDNKFIELVVAQDIVYGQSFLASTLYLPEAEEEGLTLHLFAKDSGEDWFVLGSSSGDVTSTTPLKLAGRFNSGAFKQGDLVIAAVLEKGGEYIGAKSTIVRVHPTHDYTVIKSSDRISSSTLNKLNLRDPISVWFDHYFEIKLNGSGTFSCIVQCPDSNVKITAYDGSSVLFSTSEKVKDNTDINPLVYSAGFLDKPLSDLTLKIEKTSNTSVHSKSSIYLSRNSSLISFSGSVSSWNGFTGTITISTPYPSQSYYLTVKDKDGSNKEVPTIYSASSNTSGTVTFTTVTISEDEIYSLYLPVKGQANLNVEPVYEVRFEQ